MAPRFTFPRGENCNEKLFSFNRKSFDPKDYRDSGDCHNRHSDGLFHCFVIQPQPLRAISRKVDPSVSFDGVTSTNGFFIDNQMIVIGPRDNVDAAIATVRSNLSISEENIRVIEDCDLCHMSERTLQLSATPPSLLNQEKEQASILGQVTANERDQWIGAVVELSQAGAPRMTASLDEFGAFYLDDIGPGATPITIKSLHGVIVHILNIDIAI